MRLRPRAPVSSNRQQYAIYTGSKLNKQLVERGLVQASASAVPIEKAIIICPAL